MSLFNLVFGCWHKRCSFPITVRGKLRRTAAASVSGTYVVCLDCGREFPYDWLQLKGSCPNLALRGQQSPSPSFLVSRRLEACAGHSRRPTFSSGPANNLQFPGREQKSRSLPRQFSTTRRKQDEHEYEGRD